MIDAAPPATADEQLGKVMVELYSQPGVSGSCLQLGRAIVRHDLPYSDARIADFAARLDHFIASYESVGRTVWQLCAGFEKYWLLVLCRGDIRLSVLLTPDADTATIASRATHLLMQVETVPEPTAPRAATPVASENGNGSHPPVHRADLETKLAGLLSRVIGSAQASRLIAREFTARGLGERLTVAQARDAGHAVLDYIPNRGKRSALISEFDSSL